MKPINKEEVYHNLSEFLRTKGVKLEDGSYSRGIQAGCSFLADAINLSQVGLSRAKDEIQKQLDQARQIIHEKTAPGKKSYGSKKQAKPQTTNSAGSNKTRSKGRGAKSRQSNNKKTAKS